MLSSTHALLAAVLAVSAIGCASFDPEPAVTSTAQLLEERGVERAEWRRDATLVDRASLEAEELLARPLAPGDAGRLALLLSPDLEATLAELGIAQAELAQATRFANPGLSFSLLEGGGETQRTIGLAADVVDWLTQPLRRRLGESELERVKLEVAAALFDSVSAAESALVDLQAAESIARAFEQRETAARVAAEYAQALHDAGNLTRRDLALVDAAWAEARVDLLSHREAVARAREQLQRLAGLADREAWTVAPLAAPAPLPELDSKTLEDDALRDRLDLVAARWAVDALERGQRLHRATRWLPVGVELGVERESEGGVRRTGPTVELALPIFDSGSATQARYAAEIARARAQLAGLEQSVRSQVREALAASASAAERIEIVRDELLPARRTALELAVRESYQMLIGAFELLDARDELLAAEIGLLEATADAWRARLELQRALGRAIELPALHSGHEEMEHDHAP